MSSEELIGARECIRDAGLGEVKRPVEEMLKLAGIEPSATAKHGTKKKFYLSAEKAEGFVEFYRQWCEYQGKPTQTVADSQIDEEAQKRLDNYIEELEEFINLHTPQPSWYILTTAYGKYLIETIANHHLLHGKPTWAISDICVVFLHSQADAEELSEKYGETLIGSDAESRRMTISRRSIYACLEVTP